MDQDIKVVIAAPTFQSSFHTSLCEHHKKWFKPHEMTLRSVTDDPKEQKNSLLRALAQTKPTALIAISIRPDIDVVEAYSAANVPIVLIDEEMLNVSTITTDNFMGGCLAGDHLISKGKKKIAIVAGRTGVQGGYNADQRIKGFKHAVGSAKMTVSPSSIFEVIRYSREEGMEIFPKLMDIGVDAVFCAAGDHCAFGLISAAKAMNKKVPDDIAIVGFDDLRIAQLSSPMLTTIKQPLEKIVEAAYDMVVNQRDEILRKPQKIVLKPELIVRQSS